MSELSEEAGKHVEEIFSSKLPEGVVFHNFDHIKRVHKQCVAIAKGEGIAESDLETLEIAAWFHDAGFIMDAKTHESHGKEMAESWMQERGVDENKIQDVGALILSTKMGHEAENVLEQIISDADLSHLGSDYYEEVQAKLRSEMEMWKGEGLSELQWCRLNIEFFESHTYYTQTARDLFNENKQKNLLAIKTMTDQLEQQGEPLKAEVTGDQPKKKKKIKKPARPEKGIETMFRVALRNHVQLSRLADNKANIMLSINAIVVSVVLTSLLPKLDSNPGLLWPTMILLCVCILSIIFATMSTIPSVTKGDPSREEIEKKNVNLIFFGNFHSMSLKDFDWGMRYMMEDSEYLYGSLIKDLYFLGKVLHKKYKYLRITYVVFMIGIITSVIAYVIALSQIPMSDAAL
jgi:predicted metal-dependent HD superfamily phosphohydrolase